MLNFILLFKSIVRNNTNLLFTIRAIRDDKKYSCSLRACYGIFGKNRESSTDKAIIIAFFLVKCIKN